MDTPFELYCMDGVKGLDTLKNHSVKLIYGSPPYPDAERDYGAWYSYEYLDKMEPFIEAAKNKLSLDGFIVINVKANRKRNKPGLNPTRSLIIEKMAILLEEKWGFSCVDIELWIKDNPVTTGLRCACQDAYEQILWFARSNPWKINLDSIRREYSKGSLRTYANVEYKPRTNGLTYVRKNKIIHPNPLGALPINVIKGPVMSGKSGHQARQPGYIPRKYILAATLPDDIVVDPWMGTGTTGIEALSLERKFIGFDIEPKYVEMAKTNLNESIRKVFQNTLEFNTD